MYYRGIKVLTGCFFAVALLSSAELLANDIRANSINHQAPTHLYTGQSNELEFVSSSITESMVQDAYLMYRSHGTVSYQAIPARVSGNRFIANLNIDDESIQTLEYYLLVEMVDGSTASYPSQNPEGAPVSVNVVAAKAEKDSDIAGNVGMIQYNILSPEPGEILSEDDVVIAFTMFYGEDDAIPENFKLFYNGSDVSASADISPFFISYVPRRVATGRQTVSVVLDDGDDSVEIAAWTFEIVTEAEAIAMERRSAYLPDARVELSARSQSLGGIERDIYRASSRISGRVGENIRYSVTGLMTSQEDPRLQPQNRYAAELYIGDWFEIQAGHVNPQFNPLMLAGRRVHGVNSKINLLWQNIQFQGVYGTLSRSIDMLYGDVIKTQNIIGTSGSETITEDVYSLSMLPGGMGTYQRDIMGGRVAFGSGRKFQFGLNALKVEDNLSSLSVIFDEEDALGRGMISQAQYQEIQDDDEIAFQLVSGAPRAEGNFLFGSDIAINAHNNRIQIRGDFAASLHNLDITEGVLNNQRLSDLGLGDDLLDDDIENLLNRISALIVLNERLSVLPYDFETEEVDLNAIQSMMAAQSRVGLNYFNNTINIQYRWIGPNFTSLANSSVRRDISGITVTDRFRMFRNTVFVTLGYENLNDNVSGFRSATTNTQNYNANVSWYPVPRYLPRVTVNMRHQLRNNGIQRFNDPTSIRNVQIGSDGEEILRTSPRDTETWQYSLNLTQQVNFLDLQHDVNVGYSVISTVDQVFAFGDFESTNYSGGISTSFQSLPLRTNFNMSYSQSVALSGFNNVDILGFNTTLSYMLLDDKLNLQGDFAITTNKISSFNLIPTQGPDENLRYDDFFTPSDQEELEESNSYIMRFGARYNITNNHSLIFDANFTNISLVRTSSEIVAIPNDRVIQARYVFNF